MHIQALVLVFLALWTSVGCVPLNAGRNAFPSHDSYIGAKERGIAASRHLTERSPIQSIENQNEGNVLRYANEKIRKREDDSGAIVNAIVKYDDDEITKREDDSGAIVNAIVKYDDDEITK